MCAPYKQVTELLTYDAHALVNVPSATSNGPASGMSNLNLLTVFGAQFGQVITAFPGTKLDTTEDFLVLHWTR